MIASAPKLPLLGALITSGVGLTGALLALVGYASALAMFGGAGVSTLVWIALRWHEGTPGEQDDQGQPGIVAASFRGAKGDSH